MSRLLRLILLLSVVAIGVRAADDESELPEYEDDDDETTLGGEPAMLLYKNISKGPYYVNEPFRVGLTVYNKGDVGAQIVIVDNECWKTDKFDIVEGSANLTVDELLPGESYYHEFAVAAKKRVYFHRVRPAKMGYHFGEESKMHTSNRLPDLRVLEERDWTTTALLVGRVVTLNIVKTKRGWMVVAGIILILLLLQLSVVTRAVLQKQRHLRALGDAKKM